jgi:hypothetical protein
VEPDPALSVEFPGVIFDEDIPKIPRVHVVRYYPFHQLFAAERASIFRPDWGRDGRRLVYSNGRQLFVWQVGAPGASPIPNSADGIDPARSPDGQ